MDRGVYRIIDANFNRAREAIRVAEEFCRFALNSPILTERAKSFRHELSGCLSKLDLGELLASRDTPGDVGIGKQVNGQLQRTDLKSCFIAAGKRLTEALRVLSEVTKAFNPKVSEKMESLRYTAYTLEKDIYLFSEAAEKFKQVQLYVIISSNLPAEVLSLTFKCAAGGADCIQLRAKDIEDGKLFAMAEEFVKVCKEANVVSIINDRADVAAAAGADGVHLGQNDLPVEQARKILSVPAIIGKSTHSMQQLRAVCEENVTYAALGPVYSTRTKPAANPVGLDYLTQATSFLAKSGIGHVAIGGITINNVREVLGAGVKTVAVCSAATEVPDPTANCSAFKQQIAHFNKD